MTRRSDARLRRVAMAAASPPTAGSRAEVGDGELGFRGFAGLGVLAALRLAPFLSPVSASPGSHSGCREERPAGRRFAVLPDGPPVDPKLCGACLSESRNI